MANVSTAENSAIHLLPNAWSAKAPPTVAPTVCPMVLSVRIAAMGSSMFSRIWCHRAPARSPRSRSTATYGCVTDNSTASKMEQVKEIARAAPITKKRGITVAGG